MGAEEDFGSSGSSEESWDPYIDNWEELYADEGEPLKKQVLRRRLAAAVKLRALIQKIDYDLNRTILQLGEQEMEGFITMDGEDAATGYLSTARKLGKKGSKKVGDDRGLGNTTERVRYIERSKEMVRVFNKTVTFHDKQLRGAVCKLTKDQMDRIVRLNHDNFSGAHKKGNKSKGGRIDTTAKPKGLDHDFATPRVKSASKSRHAVSSLNNIVDTKDLLLQNAIVSMDHRARNALISQNNDFIKFEALRKKQREEFQASRGKINFAQHPFATERVKQVVRAKVASENFEDTVRKKSKALATTVKRIPKPQREGFLKKRHGEVNNMHQRKEQALTVRTKRKGQKQLDTARYVRGEVTALRRRVKEDVRSAIQAKDQELDDIVADMDGDELDRTLDDCVPSGMDDLNLWKRDRRKVSWRRLSAFGIVRNDPLLYQKWQLQRRQGAAARVEGLAKGEMLGTTRSTDVSRRQPWSTDLHYTHRCHAQRHPSLAAREEAPAQREENSQNAEEQGVRSTKSSGDISQNRAKRSRSAQEKGRCALRVRPASAPLGTAAKVAVRPSDPPDTVRTPGLARLARVFYQSSIASTASMPGVCSHHASAVASVNAGPVGCTPRKQESTPDRGNSPVATVLDIAAETGTVDRPTTRSDVLGGTEVPKDAQGRGRAPDIDSLEGRMEEVRLLWAVSQLSAEAVTKKIMHGYYHRERAREPNRTRWVTPSRRPQPPSKRQEGSAVALSRTQRRRKTQVRRDTAPQGNV